MYDRIVQPILEQASIEHDVCVTTHAHHATERMAPSYSKNNNHDNNKGNDKDISEYTAVIAIGGDGILYECLQGIHFRDDAQTLLEQLSFGIVGAGTSNGMAKSIARSSHERSSILDASFLIAKGKTKAADLSVYQTRTHNPQNAAGDNSYLSFLTFNWGMVAAIDIDSEVLRSLGSLRFDLWGVWCVLKLKGYKAKFSYLPPTAEYKKNPQGTKELPPLTEALPEKDGWVTEEDDYVIFWPSHGTFASIDDCSFFFMMLLCWTSTVLLLSCQFHAVSDAAEKTFHCPPSKLDDGVFQIFLVRHKNLSRLQLAKILIGMDTGAHAQYSQVEFIECTAFRLEPDIDSINDLDGEVIESGPVQGRVLPRTFKVFCKE